MIASCVVDRGLCLLLEKDLEGMKLKLLGLGNFTLSECEFASRK